MSSLQSELTKEQQKTVEKAEECPISRRGIDMKTRKKASTKVMQQPNSCRANMTLRSFQYTYSYNRMEANWYQKWCGNLEMAERGVYRKIKVSPNPQTSYQLKTPLQNEPKQQRVSKNALKKKWMARNKTVFKLNFLWINSFGYYLSKTTQ